VLDINNIKPIPEQYILKRWTIGAKVLDITSNRNHHEDPRARMASSDESYDKAASSLQSN
jgi:zinc finger SWIM domain-containing protein 3